MGEGKNTRETETAESCRETRRGGHESGQGLAKKWSSSHSHKNDRLEDGSTVLTIVGGHVRGEADGN